MASGRSDDATLKRLAYLQDLSPTGVSAALWVAPGGNFWRFEAPQQSQIFAQTSVLSPVSPIETSIE